MTRNIEVFHSEQIWIKLMTCQTWFGGEHQYNALLPSLLVVPPLGFGVLQANKVVRYNYVSSIEQKCIYMIQAHRGAVFQQFGVI